MSRKIIGVTVGTTLSPSKIAEKLQIAEMQKQIAEIRAELAYEAIDITKFTNSAAGTYEMGTTITAVNLSWELNKTPASQTLDGASIGVDVRSESYTGLSITSNKTYSLSVTDEKGATDSASSSISFLNGVYYGVMEDGTTIDSAAVLKLTRELRGDRKKTFTANAGEGQKHAFAIPTRYGTPTFKDAETGFQAGFYLAETIQFTNASGYTEEYNVWLSTNPGMGSMTVAVS